jgi:hypothetical protein
MYGFRFARSDLQAELRRDVLATGLNHVVDADGFVVVQTAEESALCSVADAIAQRVLVDAGTFLAETPEDRDEEKRINQARGVPFLEFDARSDHPEPMPYGLIIRRESSLPPGQRPWDHA